MMLWRRSLALDARREWSGALAARVLVAAEARAGAASGRGRVRVARR